MVISMIIKRIIEAQITEENTIEIIIIILSSMGQ